MEEGNYLNRAFQAYSPRVRPFRYDALQLDTGCQDLPPGIDWFASKAFERICIFAPDPDSAFDPKVAYATGPAHTGDARPWSTRWAAWVSSVGIRVAKTSHVTPETSGGSPTSLYDRTIKPTRIALGFTSIGQMAIAIQKNEEAIRIRWYKDDSGTVESIGDVSFIGQSPVLFNNGLVYNSQDPEDIDLVLYYFKIAEPRKLYARLEREHFTIERLVNSNIQVPIGVLLSSEAVGLKQELYLRDDIERVVVFYSPEYAISITGDNFTLTPSFTAGSYADRAINADAGIDIATFGIAFTAGSYYNPIEEPPATLSDDEVTLRPSFTAGEYL